MVSKWYRGRIKVILGSGGSRMRESSNGYTFANCFQDRKVLLNKIIDRQMEKVFISGKVSGLPYAYAQERFNRAASLFQGCGVHNPVKLCKPTWSWPRCMIVCLWHLMKCDTVVFMDNWQDSRGARIENRMARLLGKKIIYMNRYFKICMA